MTSVLFCKGRTKFSELIMWATSEPISHVAIRHGNFVIHSNLRGLHIQSFNSFLKDVDIFDEIEIEENTDKLFKLLEQHERSLYDFGALIFLGISLLARKYLDIPLPKSNLWQATGMYLCTEWVSEYTNQEEWSMATPGSIHTYFLKY